MHISGVITQSAADVTKTEIVKTGVTVTNIFGAKLRAITVYLDPAQACLWGVGSDSWFLLTITSNQSGFRYRYPIVVANAFAGLAWAIDVLIPSQEIYILPEVFPVIVDAEFTVEVSSFQTVIAWAVAWRIDYDRVELTDLEYSKIALTSF